MALIVEHGSTETLTFASWPLPFNEEVTNAVIV
jgi:hypothetical protein